MTGPRAGLTPEQAEAYATEGVVRLPAAIPPDDIAAMLTVLWRRLEARHGAARDRPETWTIAHPAQLTSNVDQFAAMASPTVLAVLDQLLGEGGWQTPPRWGLPLVTLPGFADRWDVPHRNWHLDAAATTEAPRVVRFFAVLAPSRPGGGGTGFIAGSHRVVRRLATQEGKTLNSGMVRKLLVAREPWYAALESRRPGEDRVARFMSRDGVMEGVPVRVCEMLGEPGDVILMDPLVLHGTAPNAGDTPRMMLTQWVYGTD
jgi:ectoine hydroxylase-related dioxygenase (phytanoyl-CoA dioxygenase family)